MLKAKAVTLIASAHIRVAHGVTHEVAVRLARCSVVSAVLAVRISIVGRTTVVYISIHIPHVRSVT